MTATEVKAIRQRAGLTLDGLARLIFNKGTAMDARRMKAALDGLEAIA